MQRLSRVSRGTGVTGNEANVRLRDETHWVLQARNGRGAARSDWTTTSQRAAVNVMATVTRVCEKRPRRAERHATMIRGGGTEKERVREGSADGYEEEKTLAAMSERANGRAPGGRRGTGRAKERRARGSR